MATILELSQKVQRGEAPPPPIGRLLGFVLRPVAPGGGGGPPRLSQVFSPMWW